MGQFNARPSDCSHEDYPCCGCGSVTVFTGQDAVDADREDGDLMYADLDCSGIPDEVFEPDPFLTDAEADADALASAGMGTDEDYGCFDETPMGDEYGG